MKLHNLFETQKPNKKITESVIYQISKEDPMNDTEVLVLGGAGRYTLQQLRNKARREAELIRKDIDSDHGDNFRRSASNVKQLANTLNTITAAYDDLNQIRSRGGINSKGIRQEDLSLVEDVSALLARANSMVTEKFKSIDSVERNIRDAESDLDDAEGYQDEYHPDRHKINNRLNKRQAKAHADVQKTAVAKFIQARKGGITTVTEEIKPYLSNSHRNWEVIDYAGKVAFSSIMRQEAEAYLKDHYDELRDPAKTTGTGIDEAKSTFGNKCAGPFASEEKAKREASRISKQLGVERYVEKTNDGKYIVVKKPGLSTVKESSAPKYYLVTDDTDRALVIPARHLEMGTNVIASGSKAEMMALLHSGDHGEPSKSAPFAEAFSSIMKQEADDHSSSWDEWVSKAKQQGAVKFKDTDYKTLAYDKNGKRVSSFVFSNKEAVDEAKSSITFRKGDKVILPAQGVVGVVTSVDRDWNLVKIATPDGLRGTIDDRQLHLLKKYSGDMLPSKVTKEIAELLKQGTSPEEVASTMRVSMNTVAEFMPNRGVAESVYNGTPELKSKGKKHKGLRTLVKLALGAMALKWALGEGSDDNVMESLDNPYPLTWHKEVHDILGTDYDVQATLPDGSPLNIVFTADRDSEDGSDVHVEFYRNGRMDVTGEGGAQRIFATVLDAISKYIKKVSPELLQFSASKLTGDWGDEGDATEVNYNDVSRKKLYDRMIQRYANTLGYRCEANDEGDFVEYTLHKNYEAVAESNGRWIVKYWDRQSGNDSLEKVFTSKEKAEAFLAKLPSHYVKALRPSNSDDTNESFAYDVDHMPGRVLRPEDVMPEHVKFTDFAEWNSTANQVNSKFFDDNADWNTNNRYKTVTINDMMFAWWDKISNEGWVNVKGRAVRRGKLPTTEAAELKPDASKDNFTAGDIKELEGLARDLPQLKARAIELVQNQGARSMKPEKIVYFTNKINYMDSSLKVIKLMYDLLLAGEGHSAIGSKGSMRSNSYQRRFTESAPATSFVVTLEYGHQVGDSEEYTVTAESEDSAVEKAIRLLRKKWPTYSAEMLRGNAKVRAAIDEVEMWNTTVNKNNTSTHDGEFALEDDPVISKHNLGAGYTLTKTLYGAYGRNKEFTYVITNEKNKVTAYIKTRKEKKAEQIFGTYANRKNHYPLFKVYAYIVKNLGIILMSDTMQSDAGKSIWTKLSATPGVTVYGWNKGKAINLGAELDHDTDADTHTDREAGPWSWDDDGSDNPDPRAIGTVLVATATKGLGR